MLTRLQDRSSKPDMRLSFDRDVPLVEQRLRVALSKSIRNHGKRHAVTRRSMKRKIKAKNRRDLVIARQNKLTCKRKLSAKLYWAGELDELRC